MGEIDQVQEKVEAFRVFRFAEERNWEREDWEPTGLGFLFLLLYFLFL